MDQRSPTASAVGQDRKSTRLNSSHMSISYAVFCLKNKNDGRPQVDAVLRRQGEGTAKWYGIFYDTTTAPTTLYTLSLHDALPISATGLKADAGSTGGSTGACNGV